jgi:hypothetical protein
MAQSLTITKPQNVSDYQFGNMKEALYSTAVLFWKTIVLGNSNMNKIK